MKPPGAERAIGWVLSLSSRNAGVRDRHPQFFPFGALLIVLFVVHIDARRRWKNEIAEKRRERAELER